MVWAPFWIFWKEQGWRGERSSFFTQQVFHKEEVSCSSSHQAMKQHPLAVQRMRTYPPLATNVWWTWALEELLRPHSSGLACKRGGHHRTSITQAPMVSSIDYILLLCLASHAIAWFSHATSNRWNSRFIGLMNGKECQSVVVERKSECHTNLTSRSSVLPITIQIHFLAHSHHIATEKR